MLQTDINSGPQEFNPQAQGMTGTPNLTPDPMQLEFFDFQRARVRIEALINQWRPFIISAEQRRKERYVDLNVEELRQKGDIQEDETFIPDRIIDTNIIRERPDYISFLKQSHRLVIFKCLDNPDIKSDRLEDEVTQGLTYKKWYAQFNKHLDGAMLHGWDTMEVMFDPTKPLAVGFEHIGHDNLYFSVGVKDIQDAELVVRRYRTTLMRLDEYVTKFGFNKDQVDIILQKNTNTRRRDESIYIYKVYFKYQSVVYVAWMTYNEGVVSNWLKNPEKLRLGIQNLDTSAANNGMNASMLPYATNQTSAASNPLVSNTFNQWVDQDIDVYPIFIWLYKDDEQEMIIDHKGRGFLDLPVQEATSAITSAFVNGTVRASNIYGSPDNSDSENTEMIQLDVPLMHGGLYSNPIRFFNTEYPDVSILTGLNYLSAHNSQQAGKVNFAVMNRKDARKTATELDQATDETNKISSAGLADYSEFLRELFGFAWIIIKSQAMQDKIYLCLVENLVMANITPGVPTPMGITQYTNDKQLINHEYEIRPAGDIDFIERQETLTQMQQDWPVIQTTPLASQFLQDFVALRYPKQATQYKRILQQGDVGKNLVSGLGGILKTIMAEHPEIGNSLNPQDKQGLMQLEQQAMQFLNPNQNNTTQGSNNQQKAA